MSHAAEPLRDEGTRTQVLISGAVAGLISRFVIAPLDVIKIRLQLQSFPLSDPLSIPRNHRGPVYKGTYTTLRTIIAHEGVTGLWKGNIPAEALYLTYGSASFLSYRSATQVLSALPPEYQLPGSAVSFIAGAVAGTAATTVTYPLDLLRTRFAAQGTEKVYTGVVASVRDITKHEGFPGLFRGLSAGIGQIVPYMGVFFALYEGLKPAMMDVQLPLESMGSGEALAGVISGVLSKTMVFPLDTVRKRLQVQGPTRSKYVHGNIPECKGVLATVGTIFRHEGVRGLYRGLPVSLIKAAPASAITMWAYEMTMGLLWSIGVGD